MRESRSSVLWARGFRPFFLLAAAHAVVAMLVWIAVLRGVLPGPAWSNPFQWHAHEMLFGFGAAAVAGFLLTSVPVWTGRPPVSGAGLAALAGLFGVGRIAVFAAGALPAPWIAPALDVAFPVLVSIAIGGSIYRGESRRNDAFPLLVLALAGASGLTHLGELGVWPAASGIGSRLGVGILVVLVATLGGRLVPLFTGNALRRAASDVRVTASPFAERAAVPLVAAFFAADAAAPGSAASGVLGLAAAASIAWRTRGWALLHTLRDPILWSMHMAYLWIPVGIAGLAATALGAPWPRSLGVHALTVGAIGGMVLAIMSRVALGHTGRPFRAPRGIPLAYLLVLLAALVRSGGAGLWPEAAPTLWVLSGALWAAAFAAFLGVYAPILIGPRVDGKPG